MDSTLIIPTGHHRHRRRRGRRTALQPLTTALAAAGAKGTAMGGCFEGFTYLGKESTGRCRRYDGGTDAAAARSGSCASPVTA